MKMQTDKPRIKSYFSLIPHDANHVEMRKGIWNALSFHLKDESKKGTLFSILKNLNGEMSLAEIAHAHNLSRVEMEGLIDQLQQWEVLELSPASLLDVYIENACPSTMQRLYKKEFMPNKVIFLGDNRVAKTIQNLIAPYLFGQEILVIPETHALYSELNNKEDAWLYDALDFEKKLSLFEDWQGSFVILGQEVVDPLFSSRFNAIAHRLQIPWIHGAQDGPLLLIGPLFTAKTGPCYQCFETRVGMNLREHANYINYKKSLALQDIHHASYTETAMPWTNVLASHLGMEVLNFIATGTGFTRNKVLSIYLPTMEIMFNEVLRFSGCVICSATEHRDNQQLYFDYSCLLQEVR